MSIQLRTAVITAPRPRPTLAQSLTSYRRAGFDNKVLVFSDDTEVVGMDNVVTVRNEVKLGNMRNWARALGALVATIQPGDWIMICEDDISWSHDARSKLEFDIASMPAEMLMSTGAFSLYAPMRMTKLAESLVNRRLTPGWHVAGMQIGKRMWGAQCLLFSDRMARELIGDQKFAAMLMDSKRDKNIDAVVAISINDRGKNIAWRIPCLVDHDLGDSNSSLGYKDDRPELRTRYFDRPRA